MLVIVWFTRDSVEATATQALTNVADRMPDNFGSLGRQVTVTDETMTKAVYSLLWSKSVARSTLQPQTTGGWLQSRANL